jgi:hypothetical protein
VQLLPLRGVEQELGVGAAPGYRSFLEPRHPLARELLGAAALAAVPPPLALEPAPVPLPLAWVLAEMRRRFTYQARRGRRSLDELLAAARSSRGRPLAVNCLTLCSVLASVLRAGGFSPAEVFVAVGGRRGVLQYHAWVLVRRAGALLWISPETLEMEPAEGAELWRTLTFHVLFNDVHLHLQESEKRRLLAPPPAAGWRLVLYGPAGASPSELAMLELLRSGALARALSALAAGGHAADDAEAPAGCLAAAEACGLLVRAGGQLLPGSRLVVIPAAEEARFRSLARPALCRYLEVAADALPALARAFAGSAAADRFAWSEVSHAIVAGMLMDLGVGRSLPAGVREDGRGPRAPVVWAFERPLAANAFGVQSVRDEGSGWSIAQLWHARCPRPDLRIDPPLVRELGRVAAAAAAGPGASAAGGGTPGAPFPGAGRGLLWLRHHHLMEGRRLRFPAFPAADWSRLDADWQPLGAGLAAEAVAPALAAAAADPFWSQPRHRHAAVRLLLEAAADHVIAAGLLPPFPPAESAGPAWGRWLWEQG